MYHYSWLGGAQRVLKSERGHQEVVAVGAAGCVVGERLLIAPHQLLPQARVAAPHVSRGRQAKNGGKTREWAARPAPGVEVHSAGTGHPLYRRALEKRGS